MRGILKNSPPCYREKRRKEKRMESLNCIAIFNLLISFHFLKENFILLYFPSRFLLSLIFRIYFTLFSQVKILFNFIFLWFFIRVYISLSIEFHSYSILFVLCESKKRKKKRPHPNLGAKELLNRHFTCKCMVIACEQVLPNANYRQLFAVFQNSP